jgi:hypothetical protein
MQSLDTARAVADRGLDGDRYFTGSGTYSPVPGTGRHLTLIDVAVLEALEREAERYAAFLGRPLRLVVGPAAP